MNYDLIIIGSGPAGYVAAIRAGQVGLKTAIIEKGTIGGMCLNWGCIPSKAMLESAKKFASVSDLKTFGVDGIDADNITFNWKNAKKRYTRIVRRLTKGVEFLLKKNGVEIIKGEAQVISPTTIKADDQIFETKNIIIATGSRPSDLQYSLPEAMVISIIDLINSDNLPENPVVIGSNAHALELAQFFHLIGKKSALIIPDGDLLPDVDSYLSDYATKSFAKSGLTVFSKPKSVVQTKDGLKIDDKVIPCDGIINASQRKAILPPLDFDLKTDNGFLSVDEFLQTSEPGVYAVGDVNGRSKYAHTASAQGLHAVNVINGIREEYNFSRFPINIYTKPEIAQIGLTEIEIKAADYDYNISEFTLTANGKALTEGDTEGFIRLLSEKKYGEVLGVQIVSSNATDMIAEAGIMLQLESTIYDVANTIHAHPTVSEIFMESGYAAFDQPIHK